MGDFFVYILKSSVCLALFYLFYRLLLSRETFHRFNRIALMGVIVLSVIIPFIRIITDEPVVLQRPMQNLEYLLQMAQMQAEVPVTNGQSIWLPLLFAVYLGGCLYFGGRFLYSTLCISHIIRKGEKQILTDGSRLVITSQLISPFSWMGHIVISQKDMEESGEEILTHELAHIHARHSIDMLVCSLCVILQWFNPAVWLLKQELQNIHEYEADESVIRHGVAAKRYQLLLIKKAVGAQRFTSMANSFNHGKLKKRITMMLKQKSSPWARLKYLYVLPLTAVAVVAFARPEISRELEKISSAKISGIVPVEVSNSTDSVYTVREPLNIQEAMQKQLDDFSKVSESMIKRTKQKVDMSFKLILIDNEVSTYDQLMAIPRNDIYSISVIQKDRSKEILAKYNATDKKGLVSVVTKEAFASGKIDSDIVRGVGPVSINNISESPNLGIMNKNSANGPLIIVDGEELLGDRTLDSIDMNTIESISVMKDKSAIEQYKEKGKNGVILITTKMSKNEL